MKNKLWIIVAVIFIVVMAAAAILYPKLSEQYTAEDNVNTENNSELIKAVDFTVYDEQLNEVKLSDYFGKPIIVNFWATWCGPCKSELPAFDKLAEEYKNDVVFMMVNLTDGQRETMDGVKEFITKNDYKFPVYYDMEYNASNTYGVRSIPATLFINADGDIYDGYVGAISEVTLNKYIKKLLE